MASRHLGPVPGLVGNAGGLPPRPDRRGRLLRHRLGVIPARGEEQPPGKRQEAVSVTAQTLTPT